jgi:hypothetical protein
MQEWFEALTTFEKIFWYISVPFTVIFVIQLILSIAGLDGRKLNKKINEEDTEEVIKHTKERTGLVSFGLSFFSMRNSIIFMMVFGWVGLIVYHKGISRDMTLLIALLAGLVTMMIFSILFYLSHKTKKQL